MINWFWVIPWIVIIIFSAGWHFGGKEAVRKESRRQMKEQCDRNSEMSMRKTIEELYRHLDNLESKIEQIYATRIKEEHNNG